MTPLATALPAVLPALSLLFSLAGETPEARPSPPPEKFADRLHAETNVAGGLTADEVARRSEDSSGDVAARDAEIRAASAAVDQALVAFFPRLAGVARYTRYSSIEAPVLGTLVAADAPAGPLPAGTPLANVPIRFPVVLDATTFQASLSLPLSDYVFRLGQQHGAAVHGQAAAKLTAEAARRKARSDAKILYYEWARAKLSRVVAEAAVAQSNGHLDDVRKAFEAGTSSRADVLRVEAQLAAVDQVAVRARTLAAALEIRMRTIMHAPHAPRPAASSADAPAYAIGEPVDADFVVSGASRDFERLAAEAERARPEIRALDAGLASLGEQASATRGAAFPALAVVGEVTDANPNVRYTPPPDRFQTTWSVTAQLAWSPNDAFAATAAARAVSARHEALAAQRVALVDALRFELAGALQAAEDATGAQKNAARAVEAADESYRVRRSLFQNGRATSVELTDAETELTRARLDLVAARIATRVADVQLRYATGEGE